MNNHKSKLDATKWAATPAKDIYNNYFKKKITVKIFSIPIFLAFLTIIGLFGGFFSWLNPAGNGYLVPICIHNYEDLSLITFGTLSSSNDRIRKIAGLNKYPTIENPLNSHKDILNFFKKKDTSAYNQTIVFNISGRALPHEEGDILFLPSDFGIGSNNGILLSDLLVSILEYPCNNRLVILDIMFPWNNISHGSIFWDLGNEAESVIEITKQKFFKKNGKSADKVSFWTWWASAKGELSRSFGSGRTIFIDQILKVLDNNHKNLFAGFQGFETLSNFSDIVQKNTNKQSLKLFGVTQKPFIVGWGKQPLFLPNHYSNIEPEEYKPFLWPKEYLDGWKTFFNLKENRGFSKYPVIMQNILVGLIRFQAEWVFIHSKQELLDAFVADLNQNIQAIKSLENFLPKLTKVVSLYDFEKNHQNKSEKNTLKELVSQTFGNEKKDRTKKNNDVEKETLLKNFKTLSLKANQSILELALLEFIIEHPDLGIEDLEIVSQIISDNHKEPLAPETLQIKRLIKYFSLNTISFNPKLVKRSLTANLQCYKSLNAINQTDFLKNGSDIAMQDLYKADWLLEYGGGLEPEKILGFYESAENMALTCNTASDNFKEASDLLDLTLIELFCSTIGNNPSSSILFPILEPLEKLGNFIIQNEQKIQIENSNQTPERNYFDVQKTIEDFIFKIDQVKNPVNEQKLKISELINNKLVPDLILKSNTKHPDLAALTKEYQMGFLVFGTKENVNSILVKIGEKLNEVFTKDNPYGDDLSNMNFENGKTTNFSETNESYLIDKRITLLKIRSSLLKTLGQQQYSNSIDHLIEKVNNRTSRSVEWTDLIKLLPNIHYSQAKSSFGFTEPDFQDRFVYLTPNLNIISINDFIQNNKRFIKTKETMRNQLSFLETFIAKRSETGLDSAWWLGTLREIRQNEIPFLEPNIVSSLGDKSEIKLNSNTRKVKRDFDFRVTGLNKNHLSLKHYLKDNPFIKITINTRPKNDSSLNYEALQGEMILELKNDSIPNPGKNLIVPISVSDSQQTTFFPYKVSLAPTIDEVEVLLLKEESFNNLGENFSITPLSEGEKFSFQLRNNSSASKQTILKISNPKFKNLFEGFLNLPANSDSKVNLNHVLDKKDGINGEEFSLGEPLNVEVFEKTANGTSQKLITRKTFYPTIDEPTLYYSIKDAFFSPENTKQTDGSEINFILSSKLRSVKNQPEIEIEIDKTNTPGFISYGDGKVKGSLLEDQDLNLFIKGIKFNPLEPSKGQLNLNIGNLKRVSRFSFNNQPYGDTSKLFLMRDCEISLPKKIVISDNGLLNFNAKVDGGSEGFFVEAGLWDATTNNNYPENLNGAESTVKFPRHKDYKIRMTQNPGEQFFKLIPIGDDLKITWNVSGSSGRKTVYAWVKDENHNIKAKTKADVIIDLTPPEILVLQGNIKTVNPGSVLNIKIDAKDRDSGIMKVEAFVGQLEGEKLIPGYLFKKDNIFDNQWNLDYLIPPDANKGFKMTITATNGAGKVKSVVLPYDIKVFQKPTTGEINGIVKEGDRPQVGIQVKIYDAKNKSIKVVISGEDGKFNFPELAPGNYKISVQKESTGRQATKDVNVKAGDKLELILNLLS